MSRIYLFTAVLLTLTNLSIAQTAYLWQGGAVGDYQDATNWSPARTAPASADILTFNAVMAISVANVPNQTIGAIRILSGTNPVTFNTNVATNILSLNAATPLIYTTPGSILAGDILTIALTNTAAFTINSGTLGISPSTGGKISVSSDIILSGGTLDFDIAGTGGTTINAGGSITYNSGTFNCATSSAIIWSNGSDYFHAANGSFASSIPVATWLSGSTCNITGMNAGITPPAGLAGILFSNFQWNCPSQFGNVNLDFAGTPVNFNGLFTMASTGSSSVKISGSGISILTAGAYSQTGGTLVLQSSGGNTTFTINTAFSQTGGAIDFVGAGGSGTATLNLKGNATKSGTGVWSSTSTSPAAQMIIQFSGITSQTVVLGGGLWNAPMGGRCNVVNINTDPVGVSLNSTGGAGALKVINTNSPLPATCTNSGNFTGAGIFVYSGAGAGSHSLIYNGPVPQAASTVELPASGGPFNLTINNATGVSFPSSSFNRSIPGSLNMQTGNLNIGSGNILTLSNSSLAIQLNYTAGFITSGTLKRYFPTSSLPVDASAANSRFPFGSGINDRSLYLYFSSASLTGGTPDYIAVSHAAVVNATAISPGVADNGITLDKRTNSNWFINTGSFNLGSGGTTIFIKAQATNIGSVDNISTLRLTDAATGFGTLIATTGTTDAPFVGKSALTIADINNKSLYVGSDFTNALQLVSFTWTGASNTVWTNPANWTGGIGYPSSPTEIAIVNTSSGNMPVIGTGSAINVYQLTVGSSASFTIAGTGSISVADNVNITGTAIFASTSTFSYSSSNLTQNILNLPYGNLAISGAAAKILPPVTTVTGDFIISGTEPTFGTGTFIYAAGAAIQRLAAPVIAKYNNLTISGDRGGNQIRLGNGVSFNTIDVAGNFTVTATNYVATDGGYNTFNFSSTGTQTIPGFTYGNISNVTTGGGTRIFDNMGSASVDHIVNCRSLGLITTGGSGTFYTTAASKVKITRNALATTITGGINYYDFELAGNYAGASLTVAALNVAGSFTVSATNYNLNTATGTIYYNGTGSQTITAFNYSTLWIAGSTGAAASRIVTLQNTGTIGVRNQLAVTGPSTFSAGNGFAVAGSTVNFFTGSNYIPVLAPVVAGGNNYNNIIVTGGTRTIPGDLTISGYVSVTGSDASPATLYIGNNAAGIRTVTIAGDLSLTGTSASNALTGLIDFNSVGRTVLIRLAGNLSITGTSQLTTGNDPTQKGTILFNGANQQYTNTAINKNKFVNFTVGNGTNATTLILNNNLDLTRCGAAPFSDTLTVVNNAALNVNTRNIRIGIDTLPAVNNAVFNLNAGATLVTSNTGIAPNFAIEGTATNGTSGTISAGSAIIKNYNSAASYVLNGATVNPFPAAITTMANLTIGANVSLNKAIIATGALDLASYTLTQANNNLQFSGLTSTTGNIYADQSSTLSISGTAGTVGPLRFALPLGNITGQFTINRPVNISLASDLIIDNTSLTGNFITGTSSSILDINGNTLTISGAVSGPGTLSGSSTSSLTLKGLAGIINFTATKQVLKNLSLVNMSTATLGTPLDITAGTGAGTEGTVSVTGTSVLTTGGNLTLKSGAGGTSRVAAGPVSGGYINGNVSVERYLSSIRSWRFLAAPSYGQTIKQAWQENQPQGADLGTGYGTNITSNAASWAADGFDFQTPGNSLLVYKPATNVWDGTGLNTNTQISAAGANKSYMLFLRGDRSVAPAAGAPSTSATVRTKGTLFQGDQPAVAVGAGEYAAIGNNYASAIDFTLLTKSGIHQSFSVWDPKMPGAKGLGGWVTFSASTLVPWEPVPSASGATYTPEVANTRIESGQGFIVQSNGTAGSVTLTESSKLSGSRLVSRPFVNNSIKQSIKTNLYNTSTGTANIADGNAVVFSADYSNEIDEWDALKPNNFGDNFGLIREGKMLVVDARQPVTGNDTVFFNMKKVKLQSYRLEFIASNFDNSIVGFLEDNFLHTATLLNMTGITAYDFTVTSDAGAAAADRFRIVFRTSAPLPVTFTSVSAVKKQDGIGVEWKVENEINITSYEVEYSADGTHFTKVSSKTATGSTTYDWLDEYTKTGENFYRIKSISSGNVFEYSRIVKVSIGKEMAGFAVYPNPVTDNTIGLQMSNLAAGNYNIRIINTAGQAVSKSVIRHFGGTATRTIIPNSTLVSGNYQLEITGPDNKISAVKLLVQEK